MKKYRFAALFLLLLLMTSLLPVGAVSIRPEDAVADLGDFLSEAEEAQLAQAIGQTEGKCHVTLRIVLWDEAKSTYSHYWGEDYLRDSGTSASKDLILLIVSKIGGMYYYDLYLYGTPSHRIRQEKVDAILDAYDVYLNLKSGEVLAGSLAFVEQIDQRYDGSIGYVFTKVLPVALILSLIVTLIVTLAIVGRYRARKKAKNYPFNEFTRLELTEEKDIFAGSTLRRVRLSSGSGSRGGGHGGGGRGGGRGHVGGR